MFRQILGSRIFLLNPMVRVKSLKAVEQNASLQRLIEKNFSKEDQEYARDVDAAEFKLYLDELAQNEKASSKAQSTVNEQGQRLVFGAQSPKYHVLRYQVLGGVFALLGLYLFYRGDAKYTTIAVVPLVAYACFLVQKQNTARKAIPFVRQILQNNDKSLEVLIETNNIISRIQNVNGIKLAIGVKNDFSLPFGWGTADGYHVKVNGQSAVLPFNFTGNSLELKSILQS